uniref:TIR domain-containing protein n=1 Tax=Magallana gigas TaxID=29159 RepID=A0A8W8HN70_MAGGI
MVHCGIISQEKDTFQWKPQGWNGYVLFCPIACKNVSIGGTTKEGCCACHSKSVWDFSGTVSQLNLSNDGYLEGNKSARNIHVNFVKENLQFLPKNICNFPGITKINLSFNLITNIPNLSCVPNLTDLNLSYNKLSLLPKTLTQNRNLRTVDLSGNYITRLETGVVAALSAHNILLQGNQVISMDVTYVVFERPFCVINMSHNALSIPTNENNWKVNLTARYGPGKGVFSFNFFTRMPNATNIGFSHIFDFGKLFDFGFDARHNPIICDCKITEPLLFFKDYIDIMKRDYFNITCGSPEEFQGKSLPSIIRENQIKDLLCNYTSTPLCPVGCTCEESPKHIDYRSKSLTLTLIINCSGAGLKRLPRVLPYSDRIEFHMRGNMIHEITNNHYLSHVSVLDLEMMPMFDKDALDNLTRLQIFSVPESEQRKGIPRSLSRLSPCVFLQKTDFVIACTCSHLWMLDWIGSFLTSKCASYVFKCLNGTIKENLTTYISSLNCSDTKDFQRYDWMFISSSILILACLIILIVNVWKIELRIMLRLRKLCTKNIKTVDQDCVVYISYDVNNVKVGPWVFKTLEPFLASNGLSAFVPSRDLPLGSVRAEEAAYQISVSRFYLLILSEGYCSEESIVTHNEWKNIWNRYMSDSRKKLLVINFDLMKPGDVSCRKLRAFLRFGNIINFSQGEKKTFLQISNMFVE